MIIDVLLGVVVLVGSGLTAGVLFCVALSVVPAFAGVPAERYVEMHKLIGRRFDVVMPPMVLTWTLVDVLLAVRGGSWLFWLAALSGAGVAAVSQLGNVPINRRVKKLPGGPVPPDWADPRGRWRGWHLARTYLAVAGLVTNACALLLT